MEYLTEENSSVVEIIGLGTKRPVKINTHESKFVVLQSLSKSEWIQKVIEFQELIYQQHESKMIAESDNNYFKIFLFDKKKNSAFSYVQTEYLKKQLENKLNLNFTNHREISDYILQLTFSQQIDLWREIRPQNHNEYIQYMRTRYTNTVNPLDIELISSEFDFVTGVDFLISLLGKGPFKVASEEQSNDQINRKFIISEGYKQRALQLLVYLQQSNLILFSIGTYLKLKKEITDKYKKATNTGLLTPAIINSPNCNKAVSDLLEYVLSNEINSDARESSIYCAWFLMSTTISDIGDLSTEIIEKATLYKTRHYKWFNEFIKVFSSDSRYKDTPFPSPRRISKNSKASNAKTRSLDWARKSIPHQIDWINLFEDYNSRKYVTYTSGLYTNSGYVLEYLSSLENPPKPNQLSGNLHIRNIEPNEKSQTIRDFLDAWIITTGPRKGDNLDNSTKCTIMNYWRNVMEYFCGENLKKVSNDPSIKDSFLTSNPISEIDCTWKIDKSYRTHRKSMKQNFIDIAKEIILSPDENGNPTFEWVRNHNLSKYDWIELPGKTLHDWKWREVKNERVLYWQPSRAILMYLMLVVPLRTFQARWMDSGIADEYYWEKGSYKKNKRKFAKKGRKLGVIQPLVDQFLGSENEPGIYVSTNKTQIWNPEDFTGYVIPWPDMHLYDTLEIQRDWIDLVSELTHTEEVSLDSVDLNVQPKIIDLLPKFYPLFRDLSSAAGNNLPISKSKIYRLWAALCKELEDRCKTNNINVQFVKDADKNKDKDYIPIFDLHSLRVTGITNLSLRGVPFNIISKHIAGHASIAMTLHYEKQDPIEIRRQLTTFISNQTDIFKSTQFNDILESLDGKTNLSQSEVISLIGPKWFNRFLISQPFSNETSLNALLAANRQFSINVDGICPATLCDEGDENGGPVRGGPYSCGNCRFFITGTAFLYGQAHKCNLLMYEIKAYADELVEWRKKVRKFKQGQTDYEKGTSRIAEIEAKLDALVSDWWGRYKLLNASLESIGNKNNYDVLNAVKDISEIENLKLITSRSNKLELLKELSLSTELLEVDFGAKGPQIELREILNVILSKHGISPFLVGLSDETSLHLTNVIAESIVTIFQINNHNNKALAYENIQNLLEQTNESELAINPNVKKQLITLADKFKSISTNLYGNLNPLLKN